MDEINSNGYQIFFSFAEKDVKYFEIETIASYINEKGKLENPKLNVLYYHEDSVGINIDNFMNDIKNCDLLVSFFSANYNQSDACKKELETAKKKQVPILPIKGESIGWNKINRIIGATIIGAEFNSSTVLINFIKEVIEKIKLAIENNLYLKNQINKNQFPEYFEKKISSIEFIKSGIREILNILDYEKIENVLNVSPKKIYLDLQSTYPSLPDQSIKNYIDLWQKGTTFSDLSIGQVKISDYLQTNLMKYVRNDTKYGKPIHLKDYCEIIKFGVVFLSNCPEITLFSPYQHYFLLASQLYEEKSIYAQIFSEITKFHYDFSECVENFIALDTKSEMGKNLTFNFYFYEDFEDFKKIIDDYEDDDGDDNQEYYEEKIKNNLEILTLFGYKKITTSENQENIEININDTELNFEDIVKIAKKNGFEIELNLTPYDFNYVGEELVEIIDKVSFFDGELLRESCFQSFIKNFKGFPTIIAEKLLLCVKKINSIYDHLEILSIWKKIETLVLIYYHILKYPLVIEKCKRLSDLQISPFVKKVFQFYNENEDILIEK